MPLAAAGEGEEVDTTFAICLEPERNGETKVAGREAYIVEHRPCDGQKVPEGLGGRHVMTIDKESFLPLKVQEYDSAGKLRFQYEVTEIEYGIKIKDSVFADVPPPGTAITEKGPAPKVHREIEVERRELKPRP